MGGTGEGNGKRLNEGQQGRKPQAEKPPSCLKGGGNNNGGGKRGRKKLHKETGNRVRAPDWIVICFINERKVRC